MKMKDVLARYDALQAKRTLDIANDLTVAERNELRDCEITLGMTSAGPQARAEAARRVERFAAERTKEADRG